MATYRNYKKAFIHYIEQHVPFISVISSEKTSFLDICGWDGGDIYSNGLQDDKSVKFDEPETVDNFIKSVHSSITAEEGYDDIQLPEITYSEYLKSSK